MRYMIKAWGGIKMEGIVIKPIDPYEACVIELQISAAEMMMKKWNLSPRQFTELDREHEILKILRTGYEVYQGTGTAGVVQEFERRLKEKGVELK